MTTRDPREEEPNGGGQKVLVSACLLGTKCTYKAGHHRDGVLLEGPGVTAELLRSRGIECVGVEGRRPRP